ncbi:MAG: 1-acyl-sn-glycerol-3-phosphate acyltransferase [Bacteroidota bacterium]
MILRFLRASYRVPAFLLLTVVYTYRLQRARKQSHEDPWASHKVFLRFIEAVRQLMGIRVHAEGTLPEGPSLIMGNHRSYVDVVLIPSRHPVAFVARSESRNWPIIGPGATALHKIWVDRKDRESRRETREAVRKRLQDGMSIILFPEGTTYLGPALGPYRPSMFVIAAETGIPITPVAIEYRDPHIAWVGDSWFIPHAWKHFGKRYIDVTVRFGETFTGTDPDAMREQMRNWTQSQVLEIRALYDQQAPPQRSRVN